MFTSCKYLGLVITTCLAAAGHSTVFAQSKAEINGQNELPPATQPSRISAAPSPADTGAFALTYGTALPRLAFGDWEDDYAKYNRLLTPEIKRTQMGMSFVFNGVHTWWCQPSASPHAQLDTLTRVTDPKQLEGHWKSLVYRTIVHRDSAVVKEKRFYRSAKLLPTNGSAELLLSEGRITLSAQEGASAPLEKVGRKKYTVINGRYLMTYGMSKAGGAISQIGLDKAGHLLLHVCAVTERQIRGQYLTYQTALVQSIFERQP